MAMATDPRLVILNEALGRASTLPAGRHVKMVARVTPTFGAVACDLPALDPGARVAGGRLLPRVIEEEVRLDILTWNTGETSDLRKYGNLTHAERQFLEFMRGKDPIKIEIELSHSPCTACADMLGGWLKELRARGAKGSREPNRKDAKGRTLVGSPVITLRDIDAEIRWATLYDTPPQATTGQCLGDLHRAGWKLAAPRMAIPSGAPPVRLL